MKLSELIEESHRMAVEKGWWSTNADDHTGKVGLIVSELSEALEEWRDRKPALYYVEGKPEGLAVELADVAIRLADLCGKKGAEVAGNLGDGRLVALGEGSVPAEFALAMRTACSLIDAEDFGWAAGELFAEVSRLAERLQCDLVYAVKEKMRYNASRPFRHGGKRA